MSEVVWAPGQLQVVSSGRSFASTCQMIRRMSPTWLVLIQRAVPEGPEVYYVFSAHEVLELAEEEPSAGGDLPTSRALVREATHLALAIETLTLRDAGLRPAAHVGRRVLRLGRDGRPSAVGEVCEDGGEPSWLRGLAEFSPSSWQAPVPNSTPAASGERSRTATPDGLPCLLSAEAPTHLSVGQRALVQFRLELDSPGAEPLCVSAGTNVSEGETVLIMVSVGGDAVAVLGEADQRFSPPGAGTPVEGHFIIRGMLAGSADLVVRMQQGGTELGSLHCPINVSTRPRVADSHNTYHRVLARVRDRADDDALVLMIDQGRSAGQVRYHYRLISKSLQLDTRLVSAPLREHGGGYGDASFTFVEQVYERVLAIIDVPAEANRHEREMCAIGTHLCEQLFDPHVTMELWGSRDRIRWVHVISEDGYVPWELVRLRHPQTREIDSRYLGEYGLVRSAPEQTGSRELAMQTWGYLIGAFPSGFANPVGAERPYFEELRRRGFSVREIAPEYDAFFAAIEQGDLDVLHLAAHGRADGRRITRAHLIIGEDSRGGTTDIELLSFANSAHLARKHPLVFVNACDLGRQGRSLTSWCGIPNSLLKQGAGAVVACMWPVRDLSASKFATAFYDALLSGQTLAEAASAGRQHARAAGDASWLAYSVYGDPGARRSAP